MTLPVYAIYSVALNLAVAAGFLAAGALILWKAQGDWFRWLAAFVLIFFPLGTLQTLIQVAGYDYTWVMLGSILWPTFLLFLYLFPNGRAVPRWTRWPMGVILSVHLAIQTVAAAASIWTLPAGTVQTALSFAVFIPIGFVLILFCQIYRYRVLSTPIERAQVKWFIAGLTVVVVEFVAGTLLSGSVLARGHGFATDLSNVLSLAIPVSITISILRYRLWDIDVIIRKTLVYTAADRAAGAGLLRQRGAPAAAVRHADRRGAVAAGHCGLDAGHRRAVHPAAPAHPGLRSTGASTARSTMRSGYWRSLPTPPATRPTWMHSRRNWCM